MKKVDGMVVLEVTTVLTGTVDGRGAAQVKTKKVELPEKKASEKMAKYPETGGLPEGLQTETVKNLGACYENFTPNGVREIYGEEEIVAMANEKIAEAKAANSLKAENQATESVKVAKPKAKKEKTEAAPVAMNEDITQEEAEAETM